MPMGYGLNLKKMDLESLLQGFCHFLVFSFGEIHLFRIHLEHATEVGTALILGYEMEVKMREGVRVSTVVDLVGIEHFLHGTSHTGHIGHEGIAVVITQEVEVVHMVFVCHKTTAMIGLFLENEKTGNTQLSHFNHQVVQRVIVLTIQALFWITVHT